MSSVSQVRQGSVERSGGVGSSNLVTDRIVSIALKGIQFIFTAASIFILTAYFVHPFGMSLGVVMTIVLVIYLASTVLTLGFSDR